MSKSKIKKEIAVIGQGFVGIPMSILIADKIKKIDHTVGHERHQPKTWVELLHNRSKYKSVHASVTMLLHKLKSRACIQVSKNIARILPATDSVIMITQKNIVP